MTKGGYLCLSRNQGKPGCPSFVGGPLRPRIVTDDYFDWYLATNLGEWQFNIWTCVHCGCIGARIRRTLLEKVVCQAVFQCLKFGHGEEIWHLFVLGQRSHCPDCLNFKVKKLRKVDPIDISHP
jgi:hypothetical protein